MNKWEKEFYKKLGVCIRETRRQFNILCGRSPSDFYMFSDLLNVSEQALSSYERGTSKIALHNMVKLAFLYLHFDSSDNKYKDGAKEKIQKEISHLLCHINFEQGASLIPLFKLFEKNY